MKVLVSPILDLYNKTRKDTENLVCDLSEEECKSQPIIEVSPPKWHLGHTTWFFEEFVLSKIEGYSRYHEKFSYFFNSYYNNVGDRVAKVDRGTCTEPSVSELLEYRAYVNKHINLFWNEVEKDLPCLLLGLNHEQQHQELLAYDLKKIGSLVNKSLNVSIALKPVNENQEFLDIEEGVYEVGFEGEGFTFDNERNRHKVYIQPFQISNRLVTNAEFIEFIEAGGYQNFNLWHSDGWEFVKKNKLEAPYYWKKIDGVWFEYTFNGFEPVILDNPVNHISFYEAFAYAERKGMRLPTEFEWEVASDKFNWGNLWEWTNSAYLPYPGYQKAEGALGEYNGKFMVNCHVLRGGSFATPEGHTRKTYRNFFYPSSRWQFSGIRLAK